MDVTCLSMVFESGDVTRPEAQSAKRLELDVSEV